jgi:hypothetical protein
VNENLHTVFELMDFPQSFSHLGKIFTPYIAGNIIRPLDNILQSGHWLHFHIVRQMIWSGSTNQHYGSVPLQGRLDQAFQARWRIVKGDQSDLAAR